jgi:hypothetical protein
MRERLAEVTAGWKPTPAKKPAGKREADPKAAAVRRRVHELLDKS